MTPASCGPSSSRMRKLLRFTRRRRIWSGRRSHRSRKAELEIRKLKSQFEQIGNLRRRGAGKFTLRCTAGAIHIVSETMADVANKYEINVAGKYYVDNQ